MLKDRSGDDPTRCWSLAVAQCRLRSQLALGWRAWKSSRQPCAPSRHPRESGDPSRREVAPITAVWKAGANSRRVASARFASLLSKV